MTGRILTLLLAAGIVARGIPVEETFYQILGPDAATVLCDSRSAGSCDPFLAEFEFFEFGADSDFSLSPLELQAHTGVFAEVHSDLDGFIRFRHFFEDEIDLGWYAFVGGTGDFLAEYSGFADASPVFGGPHFSLDPGPFPLGNFSPILVGATFGQPFHVRAHYRFNLDALVDVRSVSQAGGADWGSRFMQQGYAPSGMLLPFVIEVVPIPEPGGLSLFGLSAILSAVAMRKYRPTSPNYGDTHASRR